MDIILASINFSELDYNVRLCIFIVACVLLLGFLLLWIFYSPIKRLLYKKQTVRMYYKKINRVVLDHDFYLINRWCLQMGEEDQGVHIDHLLFGDKFIYVIKDRYYDGAVSAKMSDKSWIYFMSKRKKKYIDNPLILNRIRADRIALASGLDRSFFVSIVLVNDDCLLTPFSNSDEHNFLLPLSRLSKFIEAKESTPDVPSFTPDELAIAVNELAQLNQNER